MAKTRQTNQPMTRLAFNPTLLPCNLSLSLIPGLSLSCRLEWALLHFPHVTRFWWCQGSGAMEGM